MEIERAGRFFDIGTLPSRHDGSSLDDGTANSLCLCIGRFVGRFDVGGKGLLNG